MWPVASKPGPAPKALPLALTVLIPTSDAAKNMRPFSPFYSVSVGFRPALASFFLVPCSFSLPLVSLGCFSFAVCFLSLFLYCFLQSDRSFFWPLSLCPCWGSLSCSHPLRHCVFTQKLSSYDGCFLLDFELRPETSRKTFPIS